MKAEGRQQGTVLIEMGCISPHNLRYALELQLRLKLLDVFGWTRGEYQFNPRASPPPETVRLEMSPAAIIYEGLRRTFDQKRLDGGPGRRGRPVRPPRAGSALRRPGHGPGRGGDRAAGG